MRRAQQHRLGRSLLTVAIILMIATVVALSIAVTTSAGHGFDQIALALPVFFVFAFLVTSTGDGLRTDDVFFESKPRLSATPSRAPPTRLPSPAHD
jgi:hypothetical protein